MRPPYQRVVVDAHRFVKIDQREFGQCARSSDTGVVDQQVDHRVGVTDRVDDGGDAALVAQIG
jgi:hypothetical protein